MAVHVTSEIGILREVIVHPPGAELLAVTPSTRVDYLYDDIIDLPRAKAEHARFVAILERFSKVHRVADLLSEVVRDRDARQRLIRDTLDIITSEPISRELEQLEPQELVRTLIEGREEPPGQLARTLNETGYTLPPLPNLFFTRDGAMAINDHMLIGSMRYGVRWTEELIMKAIFRYNERVKSSGILYDGSREHRMNYTLEGGDVHTLRCDTVVIGFSERSSPAAIDNLVNIVFDQTEVTNLIVVIMPHAYTDLHAGRSRAMRGSSTAFSRSRAASDSPLEKEWRPNEGDSRVIPRIRGVRNAHGTNTLRWRQKSGAGEGAVVVRLQLPCGASRCSSVILEKRCDIA
jgi:arginine deiminase